MRRRCAVDYADLAIIDLSKAKTPEGRAALANEVRDALSTTGFFYVVGHGYTQEETDRMFDIADVPFAQVSDEEKQAYLGKIKETGSFQGYKLRNYWVRITFIAELRLLKLCFTIFRLSTMGSLIRLNFMQVRTPRLSYNTFDCAKAESYKLWQ